MAGRRIGRALVLLGLVALSCSSVAPASDTPSSSTAPGTASPATEPSTSPTDPPATDAPPSSSDSDVGALDGVDGLVATAGPFGLRIRRPTGELVAEFGEQLVVRQPTWSRDARQLVATFIDPRTGAAAVGIIDTSTWQLRTTPALRPYFFYSWSHDARLIAALGPGGAGGTSVDILDADGNPAASSSVVGGSMYIGWEPGGDDLILHANDELLLIDRLDPIEESASLGSPGALFQAPKWIPGTRDFLLVDSTSRPGRLLRASADGGEPIDLGEARGFAYVSVHPDGRTAAIAHAPQRSTASSPPSTVRIAQSTGTPIVEIVDLATGERTPVLDAIGAWLEWSPDARSLLIASRAGGTRLTWHVWDGSEVAELGTFTHTEAFMTRYVPFADQYVETPRLWSPGSAAVVFGAVVGERDVAVAVRIDDGEMVVVGDGDVGFFSPRVVVSGRIDT